MNPSTPAAGRVLLLAGVLVLSLAACGRRGPPEAPPDPRVPRATAAQPATTPPSAEGDNVVDAPADTLLPSAVPGAAPRNPRQGYVVPKDPFILDPLL